MGTRVQGPGCEVPARRRPNRSLLGTNVLRRHRNPREWRAMGGNTPPYRIAPTQAGDSVAFRGL